MKHRKVRSICLMIIFVAAIVLLLQPAQVNAESRELYRYSIEDGKAVITGADEALVGDVVLPSTLDGCPVTSVGECAFYYHEGLTSVVIPEGVTVIDTDAFYACPDLTAVTLPDSLRTLGSGAFDECGKLAFTVYGNGKYLGNERNPYLALAAPVSDAGTVKVHKNTKAVCEGFRYVKNAKLSVDAGNQYYSVDSAGVLFNRDKTVLYYAPRAISGSYTVPQGVVEIGGSAFSSCRALTAITLADSVRTIGSYAFSYCSELASVTLGEQLVSVGYSAFASCAKLTYNIYENGEYLGSKENPYLLLAGVKERSATEFRFHENARVIGVEAFSGCNGLTTVTVPDSVVGISTGAFQYCDALTAVNIGKGVTAIGEGAFRYSENLSKIVVSADNSIYSSDGYVLMNKDKTLLLQAPAGLSGTYTMPDSVTRIEAEAFWSCEKLIGVTIGKGVREIGTDAFSFCEQLAELTVPGNVEVIGEYAFAECVNLATVTLEEGVTNVGERAFRRCKAMASLILPNSLTTIGYEAFTACDKLTTVLIPKSVSRIDEGVFSACTELTEICVVEENPCYSSYEGVLYDKAMTRLIQAPNAITRCVVPQGVKVIGESAFFECNVKTVILPDSITTIEQGAFCDSSLGKVLIPASVTQMGESAFRGISSIRFQGDMPAVAGDWEAIEASYYGSKVNVYYPAGNTTWADEAARATICNDANWVESKSYEITEGANTQIGEKGLSAAISTVGDDYYLIGVYIDGKWVEPQNYTVTADTRITFNAEYISTMKTGMHPVTLAFTDGDAETTLAIRWKLAGDLNGKDDVDEDDAIYLLQHVLLPGAFPLEQNADYDKNGAVNEDDVIYLLQHILMPDVFQLQT